jgi:membrane protease YdiL (CAAX protease family)
MVIGMSFVMGWLRLKSKSLWPCAILHASHNLFIQHIFDGMTATSGRAIYITTEFGFGMAIPLALLAFWFWFKRMDVNSAPIALS